jgi:hypothetical protein
MHDDRADHDALISVVIVVGIAIVVIESRSCVHYSASTLDPTNSVCRFLTFAAVCA